MVHVSHLKVKFMVTVSKKANITLMSVMMDKLQCPAWKSCSRQTCPTPECETNSGWKIKFTFAVRLLTMF